MSDVKIPVEVLKRVVTQLEETEAAVSLHYQTNFAYLGIALTTLREYIPKPRFVVSVDGTAVVDTKVRGSQDPSVMNLTFMPAVQIPTREAAEEIAAIYERENA